MSFSCVNVDGACCMRVSWSPGLHLGFEGALGAVLGKTFQAVFQIPINSFNLSGNTLQAKLFRLSFIACQQVQAPKIWLINSLRLDSSLCHRLSNLLLFSLFSGPKCHFVTKFLSSLAFGIELYCTHTIKHATAQAVSTMCDSTATSGEPSAVPYYAQQM